MGALSSSSSEVVKWLPEDDTLLKNAIEAGASLEALAKGAVNFTRRFSLKELQERWRTMLYDSEVSVEASARMIDYEASTSSLTPSVKSNTDPIPNPHKRTADSVRSRYYSMRKRVCTYQPEEAAAAAAVDELPQYDLESHDILPYLSDQSGKGHAFEPPPHDLADSLIMSPKICPNIEDGGEELELVESDGERKSGIEPVSRDPDPFWRSIQREEQQQVAAMSQQPKEARSSSEIMNEIMDFQIDFGNVFLMDEGEIADTSCSFYLNSPQDEVVNPTESICADGINGINGINPMNEVCDTVAVEVEVVPLEEKFMVCLLNTEDWDIPDNNDDFNSDDAVSTNPNVHHTTNTNDSANKHNLDTAAAASAAAPLTDGRATTGGLIGIKATEPIIPVLAPVTVPSLIPVPANVEPIRASEPSVPPEKPNLLSDQIQESNVIRQNSAASNELNPAANEVTVNIPPHIPNREISDKPKERKSDKPVQADNQMEYYSNPVSLPMTCEPYNEGALMVVTGECDISGMGVDIPTACASDNEGQKASDESDNEVPSVSDIEALILDMDLSPFDQENLLAKEVSRFHCAESRKSLIRLEQGARSYMSRAILSRGAFAVFYGRNLKYFIKSAEVSIGRETEDVKVDIDLGKEGRANKISRRQAVIKMDESGSFHIKNIGKCSLFVNSKEVPARKRINLSSGSLIEIRDLRFIFEINEKAVKRYIFNYGFQSQNH